jgi:ornithine cyclodeaminase
MSVEAPLWISEADVASLMDMRDAIAALEAGLRTEARGQAHNMPKTHVAWDGATLHAIGAVLPEAGVAGAKVWAHTPGGATPLLVLFESATGRLKSIIEAFALGQLRTGAASGVATRWLAAPGADELAIVGTGKQALPQVAAVVAVRPIRRIRVFGRNADHRAAFALRARKTFEIEVVEAGQISAAVHGAPIVTLATRATAPFLTSAMVASGTHINAIGAIVPSGAELAPDLLPRCSRIVVDSPAQARRLSRELIDYLGQDEERWKQVESLATVVDARASRRADADLTVFKSLGMGISDLSLAIELYDRAVAAGAGRPFPHPERVQPRLRATEPTGQPRA